MTYLHVCNTVQNLGIYPDLAQSVLDNNKYPFEKGGVFGVCLKDVALFYTHANYIRGGNNYFEVAL